MMRNTTSASADWPQNVAMANVTCEQSSFGDALLEVSVCQTLYRQHGHGRASSTLTVPFEKQQGRGSRTKATADVLNCSWNAKACNTKGTTSYVLKMWRAGKHGLKRYFWSRRTDLNR